jgi:hypothetical protein
MLTVIINKNVWNLRVGCCTVTRTDKMVGVESPGLIYKHFLKGNLDSNKILDSQSSQGVKGISKKDMHPLKVSKNSKNTKNLYKSSLLRTVYRLHRVFKVLRS